MWDTASLIRMIKVCSVLFLPTQLKIIDFGRHCGFCPPILYFPILPFSRMEHLFKIAIIFAITVIICYRNELSETKLTTNSVFLYFFALAAVFYSLPNSYLEIHESTEVV